MINKYRIVVISFFLLFLLVHPGLTHEYEQTYDYVLLENFIDNSLGWKEANNGNHVMQINGGHYYLTNNSKTKNVHSTLSFPINYEQDFIVEVRLRFLEGRDTSAFGFTFVSNEDNVPF